MSQIANNLSFKPETLVLSSGKVVSFPYPVSKALEFDDTVVVMLNIPQGARLNENVFGVSKDGTILWQIKEQPSPYPDSPYLDLNREGHNAQIGNWSGMEYVVEPKTGKILSEQYTK